MASPALTTVRIGTAGWALPKALRDQRSAGLSLLEQYAALFDSVEINSSFYKPHRRSTYERWRASVPAPFRFSVKLPRAITHELGLWRCQSETLAFMDSARGLDDKLAVLLVQLPPSRTFDPPIAEAFFATLRRETSAHIVCEARNPSWFGSAATVLFEQHCVTRAAADPVPPGCELTSPAAAKSRFAYLRLHGSPRMYYSAYSTDRLERVAAAAATTAEAWCIFDNTAAGAAWPDAAMLRRLVAASGG